MILGLTIAATFIAATATVSEKSIPSEIELRCRLENFHEEHYEKEKRETDGNLSTDEEALYPHQESSPDELADAVGHRDVGHQDTGSSANDRPQQSIGSEWRDVVPGTPGLNYPNLDRIPVTSFTCIDKEPGGYYADVATGCQVFHVCNTGGVKSSFLCPPGRIFNQRYCVCDWWYNFNCGEAVGLYYRESNQNLDPSDKGKSNKNLDPSAYGISESSPKPDEGFEIRKRFDSRARNHNEAKIIKENPTNDLSSASSGRGVVDYSSRADRRTGHILFNVDGDDTKVVSTDPKTSKKQENILIDEKTQQGFSHNEDESSSFIKTDETTISQDLSNDLASYVNYAYFQAGLNYYNGYSRRNMDDDEFDENETKRSSTDVTRSDDEHVYGERTRSGFFVRKEGAYRGGSI